MINQWQTRAWGSPPTETFTSTDTERPIVEDRSGDGIADIITSYLATGEVTVLTDTDADAYLLDLNGDGSAEVHVQRNGDCYVLTVAQDASGSFDCLESYTVSREDLEQLIPGAPGLVGSLIPGDGSPWHPVAGTVQRPVRTSDAGISHQRHHAGW